MPSRCVLPARFNGPASSANGGYACGLLAAAGAPPDGSLPAVTLHLPPPLETVLTISRSARRAHVWHGDHLVATVSSGAGDIPVEPPVPAEVAEASHAAFRGFDFHPFPGCFVCGVARPAGDGLALTPGPVPGVPRTVACTWSPDGSVADTGGTVRPDVVWAALDCPGGWTGDMARQTMVLGRMTARIDRRPVVGSRYVLVGTSAPQQGRTVSSSTALYDEDGALLAAAAAVWVGVAAGDVSPPPRLLVS